MKKNTMMKVSNRIVAWTKGLLLWLLLPCFDVHAESWHGHTHYEYSGPWSWEESNCRTIQTATGFKENCDVTITGYSGNATDLTIPEKITLHTAVVGDITVTWDYEATVRCIGDRAFKEHTDLISVTIPNTVVDICDGGYDYDSWSMGYYGAFRGCKSLSSVTIGNNVTNIGNYAFSGCSSLRNVTFPSALRRIGGGSFAWCTTLTDVIIPDNVTSVEAAIGYEYSLDGAFEGCSSVTNVVIGKGVRCISGGMFDQCSSLGSIVIPNGVANIEERAFSNCRRLASVTIPCSVIRIFDGAFRGCGSLTSVVIPESVRIIGGHNYYSYQDYGAFSYCTSLSEVTIGNGVTNIGDNVFDSCYNIRSVSVPQYVLDCRMSVVFPSSYQYITNVAYSGIITNIGASAFANCSSLKEITIPDSVKSIGSSAFRNCSGLTNLMIGNGVRRIGDYAFQDCSNLRNVYFHDVANVNGIAAWCGIEIGSYYASPFCYAQNLYLNGELVTALEIPDGVTGIGNYAFCNCDCLQSISIPDSVARVGSGAFSSCNNITSASVPQSVLSQGLSTTLGGSYQNLNTLRLGVNVSEIGVNEFNNCKALTNVTVADGNTSYAVLSDGCLYDIARNVILFCPRDKVRITIPSGMTAIGNYAFQYCTNLVSVSMPETVQSIGSASFVGCGKLSGLTIPSSVQTSPTAAFNGCDVLWTEWYRALANLSVNGGGSSGGGGVEPVDPRYVLAASPADRAIASVTVDGDCAIDQFVLTDGKVYDTVLRIINVSGNPARLTLPSGYAYERLKGTTPLTIPASSTNLLTITRTADRVFFVSREQMEPAQ